MQIVTVPSVVTGIGIICSLGRNRSQVVSRLLAGRPRMRAIRAFPPDKYGLDECVVGEVTDEDFGRAQSRIRGLPGLPRRLTRFQTLAITAAVEAIGDSGLEPADSPDAFRAGLVFGTMYGGAAEAERATVAVGRGRRPRVSDAVTKRVGVTSQIITRAFGMGGAVFGVDSACASGASAVAAGCRLIETGSAPWCLVGGGDAGIVPSVVKILHTVGVLSTGFGREPDSASRPFDRARNGFVPAEGACFLVLEGEQHAARRGAEAYCRVAGVAEHTDPKHPTNLDAEFVERTMQEALDRAGVAATELGWINAHATSTKQGDVQEAVAIGRLVGSRSVPTSAPKSMTGHLFGAAGAAEIAISALSIKESWIPPTANLYDRDPDCPVSCPREALEAPVSHVLTNSFGFGGSGCCVVLGGVPA